MSFSNTIIVTVLCVAMIRLSICCGMHIVERDCSGRATQGAWMGSWIAVANGLNVAS